MHLKRLQLHNIRSYESADITFPTGTVMLSGDIGAGKSTILLAIEFALFGLLRGELSGNSLLRHGAQEGSVELTFALKENTYTIKRTLKRTKTSIEQDAGYLLVNDVKHVGTATELKSMILNLLGYPKEMLTKKNLVYRYTVYTPQEDMKRILFEEREQRVAILRKVFDIDKYERITKNASQYAKALRERKRATDAVIADLGDKEQHAAKTKEELTTVEQETTTLLPQLESARHQLTTAKTQLAAYEQQRQQAEQLTRQLHVTKAQLLSKQQQQKDITKDISEITQKLSDLPELAPVDMNNITSQKQTLAQQLLQQEQHIKEATIKITELNTLKQQANQTQQKIGDLSTCPTCLQTVDANHKHTIITKEQQKISDIGGQVSQHQERVTKAEQERDAIKKTIEQVQQQEQQAAVINLRISHAQELQKRKQLLEQQQETVTKDISAITTSIAALTEQLKPLDNINKLYEEYKKNLDTIQEQERSLSLKHNTLVQRKEHLTQTLEILQKDIAQKLKAKQRLERTQHLHHWLTDYFIPLMSTIEQHVMAKIQHEFDGLFQQWFSILVEDTMSARLDETFTPVVTQNGFDTEIENLSGGEKTACALAYRLALNKTINSLINTINTKDLLILDEPTDGFSAEQLDKMRDVLDQLRLEQVIIVSHEQKIESFADNVIKITKTEHHSQIA